MAWFLNFYKCERCKRRWTDEWSCMCDDTCPSCGARDMSPFDNHNLTDIIEQDGSEFIAIRSPNSAEHDPDYRELGRFPTHEAALEFLSAEFDLPYVIPGWSEGPDLRCAIAHQGSSRFRVRAPE